MRAIRAVGGALIWLVASLVGLVGVLLCLTLILLPVGLVVLRLARRLFSTSMALMLPRQVAHPVDEGTKAVGV